VHPFLSGCFNSQEQARRSERDWDADTSTTFHVGLGLGIPNPPAESSRSTYNFVGNAPTTYRSRSTLPQFVTALSGRIFKRFTHRRWFSGDASTRRSTSSVPVYKAAWIMAMPPMTIYFALRAFSFAAEVSRSFMVGGRDPPSSHHFDRPLLAFLEAENR